MIRFINNSTNSTVESLCTQSKCTAASSTPTETYRVRTHGRGRTVDEWKARPNQPDNHWFDGIVGCAVAASIQGAALFGNDGKSVPTGKRLKLSEIKRQRHG